MENFRSDYKVERNKKMYEEYINTDISFNKLALKYNISPQRARYIINDLKNKGLNKTLDLKSGKKAKDEYKKAAVELRESGKHSLALEMFEQVYKWEKAKNETKGVMDVLGHIKITLVSMAEKTNNAQKKKEHMNQAQEATQEALELGKKDKSIKPGTLAIQKVHLGSLIADEALLFKGTEEQNKLKESIKLFDDALKNFPGSKAHKAWPLGNKAKSLILLKEYEKALKTLQEAQQDLFAGYEEEMSNKDQGNLKLRVWNSGVMLGFAAVYAKSNKPLLAEVYASAVINTPDPDGILTNRKKQAKTILENL